MLGTKLTWFKNQVKWQLIERFGFSEKEAEEATNANGKIILVTQLKGFSTMSAAERINAKKDQE